MVCKRISLKITSYSRSQNKKNIESFSTHYTTHTFKAEIQVMVCFIPTGIVRKWNGKWSFPPIHAYLRRHEEKKLKQLPGYRGWPFLIDWQKTMAICHHPWVQRKVSPDKETEIKKSSWEKQKQVKIFDIYYIFNCNVKGQGSKFQVCELRKHANNGRIYLHFIWTQVLLLTNNIQDISQFFSSVNLPSKKLTSVHLRADVAP